MTFINKLTWILVVLGALNWGFLGVFGVNPAQKIFEGSGFLEIIYILIGLSGLYLVWYAIEKRR